MGCCDQPVQIKKNLGKPTVQENGALLFPGPAPSMPGYKVDPANRQRLLPTHAPCKFRICQRYDQPDGTSTVMNMCNCPGYHMQGQNVAPVDCVQCPVRET